MRMQTARHRCPNHGARERRCGRFAMAGTVEGASIAFMSCGSGLCGQRVRARHGDWRARRLGRTLLNSRASEMGRGASSLSEDLVSA
jgi:hypothetical protein